MVPTLGRGHITFEGYVNESIVVKQLWLKWSHSRLSSPALQRKTIKLSEIHIRKTPTPTTQRDS